MEESSVKPITPETIKELLRKALQKINSEPNVLIFVFMILTFSTIVFLVIKQSLDVYSTTIIIVFIIAIVFLIGKSLTKK